MTEIETIETISKIGKRASLLGGVKHKPFNIMLDIEACHNNGNPLLLAELLAADNVNFAHDVFGIMANMDRATGQLRKEGCFVPRYSARTQ